LVERFSALITQDASAVAFKSVADLEATIADYLAKTPMQRRTIRMDQVGGRHPPQVERARPR